MAETSFYSEVELLSIGFKSIGKGCKISRKTSFYGVRRISIGNNVRIDDFCILSGEITLGNNIHISAYTALYGALGIILEDYTGISQRCTLISASDDFSGDYLVGPIHSESKTNVTGGPIIIKKFAHVAAHCLVLPNVTIEEGCVIGALSQVRYSTEPWLMYVGSPAKILKKRNRSLIELASDK